MADSIYYYLGNHVSRFYSEVLWASDGGLIRSEIAMVNGCRGSLEALGHALLSNLSCGGVIGWLRCLIHKNYFILIKMQVKN